MCQLLSSLPDTQPTLTIILPFGVCWANWHQGFLSLTQNPPASLMVGSTRWQHGFRSKVKQPLPFLALSHPGLTLSACSVRYYLEENPIWKPFGGRYTAAVRGIRYKDKHWCSPTLPESDGFSLNVGLSTGKHGH